MNAPQAFWAPRAWVDDRWRDHVLLSVGSDGHWSAINPGVVAPPDGAAILQGPALPGPFNGRR